MTTYLTATQAASRLGKSEKTIRRWIQEGRLVAHHPNGRKNMLAIAESDIEKLAQEEAQYKQSAEDTGELAARITHLEQRLAEIERKISVGTPAQPAISLPTKSRSIPTSTAIASIEPLERLPDGSIQHYRFAEVHQVVARTFLDHLKKGLVPCIEIQKPHRKEVARWLSPEQQQQAVAFWLANGTPFHECKDRPFCPCHQLAGEQSAASQDQEEMAATR